MQFIEVALFVSNAKIKVFFNYFQRVGPILVTASGMPTALEIKPMPNADGIGQTALDGIENEIFRGF